MRRRSFLIDPADLSRVARRTRGKRIAWLARIAWIAIVAPVASTLAATTLAPRVACAGSLRFFGHGGSTGDGFVFPDRVKIPSAPPAAINVGAGDFTLEFFLRATSAENPNGGVACGPGVAWVNGNIVVDRDRYAQGRKWGVSLLDGRIAFGVSSTNADYTLCGNQIVLDEAWHHVAVDRRSSDGRMRIWIDGVLDASAPGGPGMPSGDVSYPAGAIPGNFCSPDGGSGSLSCANSDPFLVLGAEKHGFAGINYSGALDELRISTNLRYSAAFQRPTAPFVNDATTAALHHLDETSGDTVADASGRGGTGTRYFGGSPPAGPVWQSDSPFPAPVPSISRLCLGLLLAALLASASAGFRRGLPPGD